MTALRVIAIALVFVGASLGWLVLGATVQNRTDSLDASLAAEMASLWGPKVLVQTSPWLAANVADQRDAPGSAGPVSSTISADMCHQYRYKGLLWYSTFGVDFRGVYRLAASEAAKDSSRGGAGADVFIFPLPPGASTYHALSAEVDSKPVRLGSTASGRLAIAVDRGVEHVVTVHYITGGQNAWVYSPGDAPAMETQDDKLVVSASENLRELSDFTLTARTDFADIDYPRGTLSPTTPAAADGKWTQAVWKAQNLITRQSMGIAMPRRANAGPIVARMSLFAPVSLAFFFTVLLAVVVLKGIRLHPMHLLLVAAGFFAFHILLSYLADVMNIHPAFWLSAAVSVLLVTTYLRLVAGVKFAVLYAGAAQLVYLVGFSYAFFWVGRTGLTVTICAVVTLFVLMQATGRLNWHEVFASRPAPIPPPPRVPAPPIMPPPATLPPVVGQGKS
jgi:hypothetical protein